MTKEIDSSNQKKQEQQVANKNHVEQFGKSFAIGFSTYSFALVPDGLKRAKIENYSTPVNSLIKERMQQHGGFFSAFCRGWQLNCTRQGVKYGMRSYSTQFPDQLRERFPDAHPVGIALASTSLAVSNEILVTAPIERLVGWMNSNKGGNFSDFYRASANIFKTQPIHKAAYTAVSEGYKSAPGLVVKQIPLLGVFPFVQDPIRKAYMDENGKDTNEGRALSVAGATVVGSLVTQPGDVLKTMLERGGGETSMGQAVRTIIDQGKKFGKDNPILSKQFETANMSLGVGRRLYAGLLIGKVPQFFQLAVASELVRQVGAMRKSIEESESPQQQGSAHSR